MVIWLVCHYLISNANDELEVMALDLSHFQCQYVHDSMEFSDIVNPLMIGACGKRLDDTLNHVCFC